jgi:DNA-binding MarR family transcriptional regulator
MEKQQINQLNELGFAISQVNKLFTRFYTGVLHPYRLTYPQYLVLDLLWSRDHQTSHELSERLSMERTTMSSLLKRLEDNQWIRRERDPHDKKKLLIHLTIKAKEHQAEIIDLIEEQTDAMLTRSHLSCQDLLTSLQQTTTELAELVG